MNRQPRASSLASAPSEIEEDQVMHSQNSYSAAAVALAEEHPQSCPQNVTQTSDARTRLIVVSPFDDDLVSLLEILSHTSWTTYWWTNCADAMAMLRDNILPVVLCERDLPDGSWQNLLAGVNSLSEPPQFIVTAKLVDESLWAEALSLGAYDVLAKPFDAAEVVRVIGLACLLWHRKLPRKVANAKLAKGA
jgi:DNA-binding NtrC family response regulator